MSYTKKESLVQYSDWDEKSDSHPAMKFMHDYTNEVDKGNLQEMWDSGKWQTKDFLYNKSTGETFQPGQNSWDGVKATYATFTKWYHEPYFFTCWELDDGSGWAMTGNAWVHYNLPGDATGPGVKDKQGRDWQARIPAGFYFEYKKQSGGDIKMSQTSITSDSGPIVLELLRRGVISPKDLGL